VGDPHWLAADTAEGEGEASPSVAAGAEDRGRRGRRRWRVEKRAGIGGGKAEGVRSAWWRQAAMGEWRQGGGAMGEWTCEVEWKRRDKGGRG
jgi:hypothetical protein